jgi:hypothetical protein
MRTLFLIVFGVLFLALAAAPASAQGYTCGALGVCCDGQGYCWLADPGPYGGGTEGCPAYTTCGGKTYTGISFVKQKDNGKCVYACAYDVTCTTFDCYGEDTFTDPASERWRIGPYPPGQCPPPDISICGGGSGSEYAGSGE